jgi:uncharacterized protein YjbJ (UPF0337 family)
MGLAYPYPTNQEPIMDSNINWDSVRIHWDDYREKIKDQWSRLSDDDLRDIRGDRQRLMKALQDRYTLTKDKVERDVNEFFQASRSWLEQIKHKATDLAMQSKQYVCDTSLPDMAADLQRVVRRYPLRSAFISLGIGYMLGKLSCMTARS